MLDMLNALDIGDEIFRQPGRLVPPLSWEGHIPFVYWLVRAVEPSSVVELGAYTGNSYFAFCEALETAGAGARAYAVDTWQGDEHAGWYGDEVYQAVASYNDQRFRSFSTLIRSTFDEARGYFPDGALGGGSGGVDILHVDGLHTYEAVKHDFDTWFGTLSNRAVVMFHDINVRERNFGVWRLWQELSARHPSFAFDHSFGLGIVAVGETVPPALERLFEAGRDPHLAGRIRRLFASAGASLTRRLRLVEERQSFEAERAAFLRSQAEAAQVQAAPEAQAVIAWSADALSRADMLSATKDEMLALTDRSLRDRDAMIRDLDLKLEARDRELLDLNRVLQKARDEHANSLRAERNRTDAAVADAARRQTYLTEHASRVENVYRGSTFWALTAPMRVVIARLRRRPVDQPIARLLPAELLAPPVAPSLGNEPVLPPLPEPPPPPADLLPSARDAMRAVRATRLETFLATGGRLDFTRPSADAPDISILLVLHDQAELTFGCLSALAEARAAGGTGPSFEIVVLDNGSTDATAALLARVDGIVRIASPHNLHFLRGVNRAAQDATGRHLLLLNNDAEPMPGALAAACATLDGDPSIGAVGGRIVLPDGTLQEAGSIIWRDGTCLGYARRGDPSDPDVMFRRDVDYCSGAFLLTPRTVFERLGGFDERYAPAYYEETDYCVRLHEGGLRVVFEPDVAVLHMEFGSAGTDDALALQRRNHAIFRARHAGWLARQPERSEGGERAASARRRPGSRRVLVIEDRLPKPELGSGYPRAERIAAELAAAGAELTFFPMFRHPETWADARRTLPITARVMLHDAADTLRPFLERYRGAFDAVMVCRPHNMRALLDAVGLERDLLAGVRLIYDAEAVFESRSLLESARAGRPVPDEEGRARVAAEIALTRRADVITSVSAAEMQAFRSHGASDVRLLGHTLRIDPSPTGFDQRDGIVFLGAVHDDNAPNADSLRWFASDILPQLRRELGRPDLRLRVVGMNRAATIEALAGTAFDLAGMVDDPAIELERARVLVVPTRFAAGIPHKVHQAAMSGIPIVATALIAGQLDWTDGVELLATDDAKEFAAACARLHGDRDLWNRLRDAALERASAECDPDRFRDAIRDLLADIPAAPAPAPATALTVRTLDSEEDRFAGRRPEQDFAVSVPFAYPTPIRAAPASAAASIPAPSDDGTQARPAIAILCHLFHPDLADEIRSYLGNIPFPADLFVSTDTDAKRDAITHAFAGWEGGRVEIRTMPNRGRDIGPKLVGFREVHDNYPFVLWIHSKKSLHAPFLAPWRSFLFETLLGSQAVVRSVFEAFALQPRLGMVIPQHFDPVRRWVSWNGNLVQAARLAARMGFEIRPEAALDFPSGSMFWARSAALKPLLDLELAASDFPEEGQQTDRTITHAIERLFLHACEHSGHDWIKIADPALHADHARIVRIGSPDDLARYQDRHGIHLLGLGAPEQSDTIPPLISDIPPGLARRLRQRSPVAAGA